MAEVRGTFFATGGGGASSASWAAAGAWTRVSSVRVRTAQRRCGIGYPRKAVVNSGGLVAARALQQAQLGGVWLHRVDHKLNVLRQVHAKVGGAALDVLALHVAREALGFHLLLDAGGRQIGDAGGAHQGRRRDEAGQ